MQQAEKRKMLTGVPGVQCGQFFCGATTADRLKVKYINASMTSRVRGHKLIASWEKRRECRYEVGRLGKQ